MTRGTALETSYKSYRFRSRLEARWAVFLDEAGISWTYELEGFDLGDGIYYLPDFWVRSIEREPYMLGQPPEVGFWLEIKPVAPTDEESEKCRRLSKATGHCVYLVAGDPVKYEVWKWHPTSDATSHDETNYEPGERPWTLLENYLAVQARPLTPRLLFDYDFSRAKQAARRARFEHEDRAA